MNKYLARIVAFLLVPCLLVDPVTASAFSSHPPTPIPTFSNLSKNLFAEQALESRLINLRQMVIGKNPKVEVIKTESRLAPTRYKVLPQEPPNVKRSSGRNFEPETPEEDPLMGPGIPGRIRYDTMQGGKGQTDDATAANPSQPLLNPEIRQMLEHVQESLTQCKSVVEKLQRAILPGTSSLTPKTIAWFTNARKRFEVEVGNVEALALPGPEKKKLSDRLDNLVQEFLRLENASEGWNRKNEKHYIESIQAIVGTLNAIQPLVQQILLLLKKWLPNEASRESKRTLKPAALSSYGIAHRRYHYRFLIYWMLDATVKEELFTQFLKSLKPSLQRKTHDALIRRYSEPPQPGRSLSDPSPIETTRDNQFVDFAIHGDFLKEIHGRFLDMLDPLPPLEQVAIRRVHGLDAEGTPYKLHGNRELELSAEHTILEKLGVKGPGIVDHTSQEEKLDPGATSGGAHPQTPPDLNGPKRSRNPMFSVIDHTHVMATDLLHRGHQVRFATGPNPLKPENVVQSKMHQKPAGRETYIQFSGKRSPSDSADDTAPTRRPWTFQDYLARRMQKKGLNQPQLANITGISQTQISNYLINGQLASKPKSRRLALAFGDSPEDLWNKIETLAAQIGRPLRHTNNPGNWGPREPTSLPAESLVPKTFKLGSPAPSVEVWLQWVGARIRQARLDLHLTQSEMALRAGISPSSLSAIELGKKGLLSSVIVLAKVVKIAPEILLDPRQTFTPKIVLVSLAALCLRQDISLRDFYRTYLQNLGRSRMRRVLKIVGFVAVGLPIALQAAQEGQDSLSSAGKGPIIVAGLLLLFILGFSARLIWLYLTLDDFLKRLSESDQKGTPPATTSQDEATPPLAAELPPAPREVWRGDPKFDPDMQQIPPIATEPSIEEVRTFIEQVNPILQRVFVKEKPRGYPFVCDSMSEVARTLLRDRFGKRFTIELVEGLRPHEERPHWWLELVLQGQRYFLSFTEGQFDLDSQLQQLTQWDVPAFLRRYFERHLDYFELVPMSPPWEDFYTSHYLVVATRYDDDYGKRPSALLEAIYAELLHPKTAIDLNPPWGGAEKDYRVDNSLGAPRPNPSMPGKPYPRYPGVVEYFDETHHLVGAELETPHGKILLRRLPVTASYGPYYAMGIWDERGKRLDDKSGQVIRWAGLEWTEHPADTVQFRGLEIKNMKLQEDVRGRGIGKQVIRWLSDRARSQGMWFGVNQTNNPEMALLVDAVLEPGTEEFYLWKSSRRLQRDRLLIDIGRARVVDETLPYHYVQFLEMGKMERDEWLRSKDIKIINDIGIRVQDSHPTPDGRIPSYLVQYGQRIVIRGRPANPDSKKGLSWPTAPGVLSVLLLTVSLYLSLPSGAAALLSLTGTLGLASALLLSSMPPKLIRSAGLLRAA